jgi:hypothetical protein
MASIDDVARQPWCLRRDYGEDRFITAGRCVVLVWTSQNSSKTRAGRRLSGKESILGRQLDTAMWQITIVP